MRCGGVLPAVNSVPNHRAQRNALFGLASCLGSRGSRLWGGGSLGALSAALGGRG